jgi:hypothetical protein
MRDGKQVTIALHREVLGLEKGDGREGDHINLDTLDNRRQNLRVVTRDQQTQNATPHGRSRFRGVSYHTQSGKWQARCWIKKKCHYLGLFEDEDRAAEVAAAFRAEHMPYATN